MANSSQHLSFFLFLDQMKFPVLALLLMYNDGRVGNALVFQNYILQTILAGMFTILMCSHSDELTGMQLFPVLSSWECLAICHFPLQEIEVDSLGNVWECRKSF